MATTTTTTAQPGPAPTSRPLDDIATDAFAVLDVENLLFPFFTPDPAAASGRGVSGEAIARFDRLIATLATGSRQIVAVGDRRLMPHLIPTAARYSVRLVPTRPGPNVADLECIGRLVRDVPQRVH